MKKTSMNFADHQASELTKHAATLGIGFAEIVRRALDEWLAAKREKRPMTTAAQVGNTVYVKLVEGDYEQTFRNAEVIETAEYGHIVARIDIQRGEKTLGSFNRDDVKYWYIEEADAAS